jgi:hypothetical protein
LRLVARRLTDGLRESKDQGQRLFRARPELPDQLLTPRPDEPAQHERDDDRVVELSCDWDEVGNEVDWQCQVADAREQEELAATGDARVAGEPADKNDAVGDEREDGACIAAAAPDGGSARMATGLRRWPEFRLLT